MNTTTHTATLTDHLTVTADPVLDLDERLRRAFQGDRDALNAVARGLRAQLVCEACEHLGDLEAEADDVVQDVFVAILDGRLRAPPGRGEELARLLRLTRLFARRRRARGPTLPCCLD